MNNRSQQVVRTMIKERAVMRVAFSYHDGQVNCRFVENTRSGNRYFMQGQLCRDAFTGRFVSLKEIQS